MDGLRLIGGLEAQIADFLIVQTQFSGREDQIVRILNMDHGGANDLFTADHVHRHIAGLAGGGKHSVRSLAVDRRFRHSAHGSISYHKGSIRRQRLGSSAGIVHGAGSQVDRGVGRIILSVRRDRRMVKFAGSCHSGNDKNRAGNAALAAAGGRVAHGQVALTLALGDVCRGAAFIQLNSGHAAQRHHHMCFFLSGVAYGAGCHGTIGLKQHNGTVFLDTHAGAGIVTAVTGLGDNDLAIPHHSYQRIYSLHNFYGLALLCTLVGLGLCKSGAFFEHIDGAVIKGGYIGAVGIVVMHHTVHHQIAGRLAGVDVEPRGVDTAHYVQASLLLIDMCLRSCGFQCPAQFLGVTVAVTGYDFSAAIGSVHLHDIGNSLGVASLIVGGDDPFGHVGCDRIIFH